MSCVKYFTLDEDSDLAIWRLVVALIRFGGEVNVKNPTGVD